MIRSRLAGVFLVVSALTGPVLANDLGWLSPNPRRGLVEMSFLPDHSNGFTHYFDFTIGSGVDVLGQTQDVGLIAAPDVDLSSLRLLSRDRTVEFGSDNDIPNNEINRVTFSGLLSGQYSLEVRGHVSPGDPMLGLQRARYFVALYTGPASNATVGSSYSMTAVPEPSGVALGLAGALGLVAWARRRSKSLMPLTRA